MVVAFRSSPLVQINVGMGQITVLYSFLILASLTFCDFGIFFGLSMIFRYPGIGFPGRINLLTAFIYNHRPTLTIFITAVAVVSVVGAWDGREVSIIDIFLYVAVYRVSNVCNFIFVTIYLRFIEFQACKVVSVHSSQYALL